MAIASTVFAIGGGLLLPPASAIASDGAKDAESAVGTSYGITLITGDVVHYKDLPDGQDVVTVDRAEGATGGVEVQTYGASTYVLPSEVLPLLAKGKLDHRLFNVTELAEAGYDDKRSGGIPLIATAPAGRSAHPPAAPRGAKAVRKLASVDATAMKADSKQARAFWKSLTAGAGKNARLADGIGKVWLDGRVKADLSESVRQVGAPEAWAQGFDGEGVKVAVLDTGIDTSHPDVQDTIVGSRSFIPGEEVTDKQGHGTHVASTIAGSGAASDGRYKGVAPGADLLIGKVLSDEGFGLTSEIIAGMEWAKEQGADVVNMSLGSSEGDDGTDPMAQAVNALSADGGPLFVIAAGNAGQVGTIGSPGSAESALTVAAVDKSDQRASFSSQGPLVRSYALKPDVSAPGVDIEAAASQAVPGQSSMYQKLSGTSMATPHVAGGAAILKQRHQDWSGQRIKNTLMSSSKRLDYDPYSMGTGRLDIPAALDTTIEATGSVEAAVYSWPYKDAEKTDRTVTYRNTGDADVTLDLALNTQDPAYSLSDPTVTVPAGGTAEVTLSLDPTHVPANTSFSGQVVATDTANGEAVAHTGFALFKEQELYSYTIKLTGRDGKPASGVVALTFEGNAFPVAVAVDGETTLRLRPETYTAWSWLDVTGERDDSLGTALLSAPETVLDKDTTVHLDASKARKVTSSTEQETEISQTVMNFHRSYADGTGTSGPGFDAALVLLPEYDAVYAAPTQKVTKGTFKFMTHWRHREKLLDAETGDARGVELTSQQGTAYKDGRSELRTVSAGKGSAADYVGIDARGKAVLVTRSDEVGAVDRARAAAAAGAAMLITVNDGQGRLYETYANDDDSNDPGIAIASVTRTVGAQLIAEAESGKGKLDIEQKRFPDYLYDLVQTHDGAIPDRSLAYAPRHKELAEVSNTFYGHREVVGRGFRYFIPEWGHRGVGIDQVESYPGTRTEYVTPTPADGRWYEEHSIGTGSAADLQERGRATYRAGKEYAQKWFAPIQHPRFGVDFGGTLTDAFGVQVNVPMWSGSGTGHSASMPEDEYETGEIAVYQGDTLIKSDPGRYWANDLPREVKSYRVVATGSRDGDVWKTSTRTRTEWGFTYQPLPEGEFEGDLQLLNLAFDLDTDLAGDVAAGCPVRLGLSAATQEWVGKQVKAKTAALQVSYNDGESWAPVKLKKRANGQWQAEFTTPDTPGATVSIKASAETADGLSIDQEVIKAFGLKKHEGDGDGGSNGGSTGSSTGGGSSGGSSGGSTSGGGSSGGSSGGSTSGGGSSGGSSGGAASSPGASPGGAAPPSGGGPNQPDASVNGDLAQTGAGLPWTWILVTGAVVIALGTGAVVSVRRRASRTGGVG
ncbi:S8 family serine peptidase [Streptomyces sp. N35]|uniref:S8 family serine peptidase n=1 Tax=Streptomyces sp. N35 TaxID=2795730 RepID=UPI0027DE39EF|nr:S8 family serine peptidase [Streptomyces sp. N35]